MGRTVSFGVHQVKVKPRPLVGTRTFIKETEREMRNQEWSDGTGRFIFEALRDNAVAEMRIAQDTVDERT